MWPTIPYVAQKNAKKIALVHFWPLFAKKNDFFINSLFVIVLGYFMGELAPGGAKMRMAQLTLASCLLSAAPF